MAGQVYSDHRFFLSWLRLVARPGGCCYNPAAFSGWMPCAGRRHAQDQGNARSGRRRSGRPGPRRGVTTRDRLPRPYAGAARPPQPDRPRARGEGRSPYRFPSHHRGYRHRHRPGGGRRRWASRAGIQRYGEAHDPDGRDPDPRGARRLEPPLSHLEGGLHQAEARRDGYRALQGMVPGLRAGCRADPAYREPLRREQPPYRRELLQGSGARAARARSRSIRASPMRCPRPRACSAAA